MSVGTEGSGPNPRTYSRAEYAALEAENARLNDLISAARRVTGAVIEERDALRAELAEVKGREAVQYQYLSRGENARWWNIEPSDVEQAKREGFTVRKLYTTPPASPDVEGLVKALEEVRSVIDAREMPSELALAALSNMIDTALSTWRQAHTPSTLPASSAEE